MPENTYIIPELSISDMKRIARKRLKGQWGRAFGPALMITALTMLPAIIAMLLNMKSTSMMMADMSWLNSDDPLAFANALNNTQLSGAESAISSLSSIFQLLTSGALSLGLAVLGLRIIRAEEYSNATAFEGFNKYGQSLVISLLVAIYSALWSLITIVPAVMVFSVGIVLNPIMAALGAVVFVGAIIVYLLIVMRYSMAYYSASDDRTLLASHAVANSVWFMKGRTGKFFLFQLSFIGWALLSSIPLCIGASVTSVGMYEGSNVMIIVGIVIMMIGVLPLALLQLYITTAQAVYYSTLSGNISVAGASAPVQPVQPTAPTIPANTPDQSGLSNQSGDSGIVIERIPPQDVKDSWISGSYTAPEQNSDENNQ